MTEITPAELDARFEDAEADPFVLDIRHRDDYEEWHIPGSENVDIYTALQEDPAAVSDRLSALPREREIVTVCAAGVVSQEATAQLRELGYDAKTLRDGMNGWSRVHRHAAVEVDIDGSLIQVTRPGKGCLSYVLIAGGRAAVFDPSQYTSVYEGILDEFDATLMGVFDTHAHADHVSGGRKLAEIYDVPYYLHPKDGAEVNSAPVTDGQSFTIGGVEVEVLHTPGHSPGGVSYRIESAAVLTGDTLFHESVGRVELGVEAGIEDATIEENATNLYESLQKLQSVPPETLVLPAHDPGAPDPPVSASLSEVEAENPDVGRPRDEFVDRLAADIPEHPPNFQRVKRVNTGVEFIEDDEARKELEHGPNRCAAE